MKTVILLILTFLCLSCTSIKVQPRDFDWTQKLVGKIKFIKVKTCYFSTNGEEITNRREISENYFDKKNRILKQIEISPGFIGETTFIYNKDLLQRRISTEPDFEYVTTYLYDKNKNVIEKKQFLNDSLTYGELSKYDSKANLIELRKLRIDINDTIIEKYTHDNRTKTITIKAYDRNGEIGKTNLVYYFNKNGYIYKSEYIHKESQLIFRPSEMEYDKFGNLIRWSQIDKNVIYRNTYDLKGNVVERHELHDNKLVAKTEYKITYW